MAKNEKAKLLAILQDAEKRLSKKYWEALLWVIANLDFVKELCANCPMPREKLEAYKAKAQEEGDAITLMLTCCVEVWQHQHREP